MSPSFQILLAEDNPGDVRLFQEALNSRGLPFEMAVAPDGQKAIAMVKSASAGETHLDLIVLDVNLPRHTGDEVLRHVRSDPALSKVPVIVLTSSSSPADEATATCLGANLYLRKPSDLDELLQVAKVVEDVLKRSRRAQV